ncbi:MAG: TIGR04133 family radical SAM/SPASM protein [Bacteroidaceae bacterium]|nr:TIGR04133 family radical SAM/SPASM protein [Bacteroidaceae bacterium]
MASRLSLRRVFALEAVRQIQKRNIDEHPLRQLFWECTLRCNLRCQHCGSDCKVTAGTKDMPKEDFLRVLDEIAARTNPHDVFVILTGGEPTMRADLEECGRAIYDKGFPWGMVTNGMMLTPERFERLLRSGMHSATVSLDGFEDDHNWMRGNPQSFRRAVEAVKMMIAHEGFLFDVVTCVNRRNIGRLPEFRDWLVELGLTNWRLFTVFPSGRAVGNDDLQLTPDEFHRLMAFVRDTRRDGRIRASYGCEGFLGNYEGDVRDTFFFCQAGVSVASVLADGSISACASIRSDYHQGNIYEDHFMDVWEQRFRPFRDRSWMKQGECADCRFFRYCRGGGMHLRDGDGQLAFCHLHRFDLLR